MTQEGRTAGSGSTAGGDWGWWRGQAGLRKLKSKDTPVGLTHDEHSSGNGQTCSSSFRAPEKQIQCQVKGTVVLNLTLPTQAGVLLLEPNQSPDEVGLSCLSLLSLVLSLNFMSSQQTCRYFYSICSVLVFSPVTAQCSFWSLFSVALIWCTHLVCVFTGVDQFANTIS